ncbi:DeoR/GlpR family DNA-binding transcription regulator [Carnobacterium mobile]|uniref:DeoR/GlpR family DNA-binding transcription regulator n=1 Tax=Carnobacterium mobile TaxID=2750 RepID=UPI001865DA38|nr:DeoR/GlpR family DNA-binding transcription regulator [Carnobacterium mobile]
MKRDRLLTILAEVNKSGTVKTADLIKLLNVSDMTVRRDLDELAESGKIIRLHGGAQSVKSSILYEASHIEKRELHIEEKQSIAEMAAAEIKSGETIFIGPGTTLELLSSYIQVDHLRVVTNSLPVFEIFQKERPQIEIVLTGGTFRERSGAFVGELTNGIIEKLKFNRAFVGVNGIRNESLMTADTEEGQTQRKALNNAQVKYILTDYHKLNKDDFYRFYSLYDIDYLITNHQVADEILTHYQQYTKVKVANSKKYAKK